MHAPLNPSFILYPLSLKLVQEYCETNLSNCNLLSFSNVMLLKGFAKYGLLFGEFKSETSFEENCKTH